MPPLRLLLSFLAGSLFPSQTSPSQLSESLLATDRRFSSNAQAAPTRQVFAEMLADSVMWQTPQGFVRGRNAALAAFDASPEAATSRLRWTPIRAGVSADGQHGFTFGYMTQTRADGTTSPLKYMAYWVRTGQSWRVLAYKRSRSSEAATDTAMLPPSLPGHLVPPVRDITVLAAHRTSVMDAERAFSAEAQRVGVGNAFATFGLPDAVNLGGGTAHVVKGNMTIARDVSPNGDLSLASVRWAPDTAFVASSGDLGITFGRITPNEGPRREIPFFTIWRRADARSPWRYVAE